MSRFRSNKVRVKKTVNVGTTPILILDDNANMDDNQRLIQNTGSTNLYVSYGEPATVRTNGEIVLEPNSSLDTSFQGKIYGIRETASTDANNCSVITI